MLERKERKEQNPNHKDAKNNIQKSAWQELSDSETEEDEIELEPLVDIIATNFFEQYSLRLVREASADEDPNLLTTNLL